MSALEDQTQKRSQNSRLGNTIGSPLVHLAVSCSTVACLFAQMHLCNPRSPLSSISRSAPLCYVAHFAMHSILSHLT
ncbi:hypothetical protein TNCV_3809631 [Trichonephila clavipes]|nr:hypothetical protein TNCV_3809631 [Trichonephila clavipes]